MNVKPDEIANVCAIYRTLRTARIARQALESYVAKCLLLDSYANPRQIIDECVTYGLLDKTGSDLLLTNRGRELAKRQQSTRSEISGSARDFLLTSVYLDPRVIAASCRSFLLSFRVDVPQATFVYDRTLTDGPEVGKWLRVLHRVGLLEVNEQAAMVRRDHLELFNTFLERARTNLASSAEDLGVEKDEVGELAEFSAVEHEIARLKNRGHPDLALLVQRISEIDKSAGYDVVSRKGSGKQPEQPIYIEVKGTRKLEVSFIWTRNEQKVASQKLKDYWIYVFTNVDLANRSCDGPVRINNPWRRLNDLGYKVEALAVYVRRGGRGSGLNT